TLCRRSERPRRKAPPSRWRLPRLEAQPPVFSGRCQIRDLANRWTSKMTGIDQKLRAIEDVLTDSLGRPIRITALQCLKNVLVVFRIPECLWRRNREVGKWPHLEPKALDHRQENRRPGGVVDTKMKFVVEAK